MNRRAKKYLKKSRRIAQQSHRSAAMMKQFCTSDFVITGSISNSGAANIIQIIDIFKVNRRISNNQLKIDVCSDNVYCQNLKPNGVYLFFGQLSNGIHHVEKMKPWQKSRYNFFSQKMDLLIDNNQCSDSCS